MRVNSVIKYGGYNEQRESSSRCTNNTNQSKDNNVHISFVEILNKVKQKK